MIRIGGILVVQDVLGNIGVVPIAAAGVLQKIRFIHRNTHEIKVVFDLPSVLYPSN